MQLQFFSGMRNVVRVEKRSNKFYVFRMFVYGQRYIQISLSNSSPIRNIFGIFHMVEIV